MAFTHIIWLLGAGVFGFAIAAFFGGVLRLPRRWFLIPYILGTGGLLAAYVAVTGLDVARLVQHNLIAGLVGGIVTGAILVINVLSQPLSDRGSGFDLLWAGIIYGTVDGLLLTVMPVIAIWQAFGPSQSVLAQVGIAALGMLGSIYVTAAYHLGYPEFRGPRVGMAVVGNSIITLAVLLTGNPLAAILSHAMMHVAAVLHGPETTVQLPPHHETAPQSL
jgi:hypothetical protein